MATCAMKPTAGVIDSWWRHGMETLPVSRALYEGIANGFPQIEPAMWRAWLFYLLLAWSSSSTGSRIAGDLRRHGNVVTSL